MKLTLKLELKKTIASNDNKSSKNSISDSKKESKQDKITK